MILYAWVNGRVDVHNAIDVSSIRKPLSETEHTSSLYEIVIDFIGPSITEGVQKWTALPIIPPNKPTLIYPHL